MGSYIQLNFKQQEGMFQSVIGKQSIDTSKEISYFEVEIDNMPNASTTVVIGFASDVDFVKNCEPGTYAASVGFKSSVDKSEVILSNKTQIEFEFSVKYGEVFGFFFF